jgi:hypothetical protein
MPVEHVIDDYGRPRLPLPARAANVLGAPFARRLLSFGEDELHEAARKRCKGLDDFGPDSYLAGFRALTGALDGEAGLSALGRFGNRQLIIGLLCSRLRLFDLLKRHPEIREERIEAPIIIAGLPRTGTTHLHNLIGQDPALRSLPYYESLEPIPAEHERDLPYAEDPRVKRCAQGLNFLHWLMPLFPAMHEMTPDSVHEEIQLLAVEFSTMLFESSAPIPSYSEWYKGTDQTDAYRFLHLMLQALQWLRGPRRWVLKSPQHLEQIGPLNTVFPDAWFVQTHRDPVRILTSLCTMIVYGQRMALSEFDARKAAQSWVARGTDLLRASVEQRALLPTERTFDVYFSKFMKDDIGMVRRVYEFAGRELSADALDGMQRFMDSHPRGRFGTIRYDLADFGIDEAELRRDLAFYRDHFDVEDV